MNKSGYIYLLLMISYFVCLILNFYFFYNLNFMYLLFQNDLMKYRHRFYLDLSISIYIQKFGILDKSSLSVLITPCPFFDVLKLLLEYEFWYLSSLSFPLLELYCLWLWSRFVDWFLDFLVDHLLCISFP